MGTAYLLAVAVCETISPLGAGFFGNGPWFTLGLSAALLGCFGFAYTPLVVVALATLGFRVLPEGWGNLVRGVWVLLTLFECLLSAYVQRRWIGRPPELKKPKDFWLLLCASAFPPATIMLWGAKVMEGVFGEPLLVELNQAVRIFLSHAAGLLVVQAFVVSFLSTLDRPPDLSRREKEERGAAENALQLASLCCLTGAAIVYPDRSFWQAAGVLPVLWIALRHGLFEASSALLFFIAARWLWPGFTEDGAQALLWLQQDCLLAVGGLATGSFVSARRRREARLRAELEGFRKTLSQARVGTWNWDGAEAFHADSSLAVLLGFDEDFFDGKERTWRELVHPADLGLVTRARENHWLGKTAVYEADYRLRNRGGVWLWVQDRGSVVERNAEGHAARMVGVTIEIDRAKAAELRQRRILRAFDTAPDLLAVSDAQGSLLYTNRALMLLDPREGTRPGQRRTLGDVLPERLTRALLLEGLSSAASKGRWRSEDAFRMENGSEAELSLEVSSSLDPGTRSSDFALIGREIGSLRREQRTQLERQRRDLLEGKYESLRRLAGGMGHDFNNLLTAMLGGFSLVRFGIPPASPARAYFRQIDDSGAKAVDLGRFLHMYAGRMQVHSSLANLNVLLRQKIPDVQHLCLDKCRVLFELDDSIPPVGVDAKLVEDATLELVRNALEALDGKRGRIVVRTGVLSLDPASAAEPFDMPDLAMGTYVYLEVADDGPGLGEWSRNHLFVPFCTQKSGHEGTGLAGVLGAMRAHQGAVRLLSRPGEGCRARLLFPPGRESRETTLAPFPKSQEWKCEGKVLVVDDEEAVRAVSLQMLRSMGFTPLEARNGAEALDMLREHGASLRVVLLDLTMGGMDGEQTFGELRRMDATLPIVIMSGCSEQEIAERFRGRSCSASLPKPFKFDTLRAVLERVLGKKQD